jgi:hypothetical protein
MNYIPTPNRLNTDKYIALDGKKGLHHKTGASCKEYFTNGLTKKYDAGEVNNNKDWGWYPLNGYGGGNLGVREFSSDNQEVLETYFLDFLNHTKKDRIVIVEIGVSRNAYENTSVSVFLKNKRPQDVYFGIDIDDKSFLDDVTKNIHTVRCPSENMDKVLEKMSDLGIYDIDILMIDGWHSINQCYFEWENYTQLLASGGMVFMHDTNFHPGPYFLVDSIDVNQYDVYKHLWDIQDWGISVAVKKT